MEVIIGMFGIILLLIVIFLIKFKVKFDVIKIYWNEITTPQNMSYSMKYSWFEQKYGDDVIKKSRNKFINIKHQLDIYGYKIFKKEINGK